MTAFKCILFGLLAWHAGLRGDWHGAGRCCGGVGAGAAGAQAPLHCPIDWPGAELTALVSEVRLPTAGLGSRWRSLQRRCVCPVPSPHHPSPSPFVQSLILPLMHAGLTFRYPRWQPVARLQALFAAVAVLQTVRRSPCSLASPVLRPGCWSISQVSSLLTNAWTPEVAASGWADDSSAGGAAAADATPLTLLSVPPGVDQCFLLLVWVQASVACCKQTPCAKHGCTLT